MRKNSKIYSQKYSKRCFASRCIREYNHYFRHAALNTNRNNTDNIYLCEPVWPRETAYIFMIEIGR